MSYTVEVENEKLFMRRSPDVTIPLAPVYADAFNAAGLGLVRFIRDPDGRVTEFRLDTFRARGLRFSREGEPLTGRQLPQAVIDSALAGALSQSACMPRRRENPPPGFNT